MDEFLITETRCWRWSLRPIQCTLGAGILSLKRPAETMSELTTEEGADLIKIIKIIEPALKNAFKTEKINYLMLMMKDFHIHYHVLPRYPSDMEFAGHTFKDLGWPLIPILEADSVENEVLVSVKSHICSFL